MTSAAEPPRVDSAERPSLRGAFVGVRGRLLALVLLALVPALGLTLYRALEDRRSGTADAEAAALAVAESASRTEIQLIGHAHQLLFGLTQLPAIRDAAPKTCSPILARLMRKFDVYANLGVIAPNGDIVCSGLPLTGPVNAADRTYFQRARARRETSRSATTRSAGSPGARRSTWPTEFSSEAAYEPSSLPLSTLPG